MKLRLLLPILVVAAGVSGVPARSAAEPAEAAATLRVESHPIAGGAGLTWKVGRLSFAGGPVLPVTVTGISLGAPTSDVVAVTGELFSADGVEDISGVYSASTKGAVLIGGKTLSLTNPHGVELRLKVERRDVRLAIPTGKVRLKLDLSGR